jgi:hypothetical protein
LRDLSFVFLVQAATDSDDKNDADPKEKIVENIPLVLNYDLDLIICRRQPIIDVVVA